MIIVVAGLLQMVMDLLLTLTAPDACLDLVSAFDSNAVLDDYHGLFPLPGLCTSRTIVIICNGIPEFTPFITLKDMDAFLS